jgi:MFS transporter, ACDE family, multidrug resistance protein
VNPFPNPKGRSPTLYRAAVPGATTPPRTLLVLIFAVTATGIMGNSLIAPLIPDILDDLDIGDGGAGFLVAAVSLPGIVMAPLIGVLADRFGRRNVLVPCLAMFGLCGLVVAAAPTFAVVLAARFGQGIGAAGLINLSVVLIGDHWDGEDRTRLIGRNSAVLTVGLAAFPLLSGLLAEVGTWRLALAPYGFALFTAVAAWRVLADETPRRAVTVREQLGGLGAVVRRPAIFAVLVSGFVTFVLIFGVFLATLPLHLEREFSLGSAGRGLFLSIPALTASVVAFNLHRITSRVGRRVAVVAAASLFVLAFTLIGVAPTLVLIVLGAAIYGLGEGAMIPTLQDIAVTEAPPEHRGAVVAVWVGSARLGQTLGPIAAAVVFSLTSTTVALLTGAALAGVLLVIVALGPLGRPVRPIP